MESQCLTSGINENTYNLLFKDNLNLIEEEQGSYNKQMAWIAISKFTKNNEITLKEDSKFVYSYKDKCLGEINYCKNKKACEYKDDSIVINFKRISDQIKNKELIKELTSDKRNGHCHSRSVEFSQSIKDSSIVTGYLTIGKKKVLHSVIEYKHNGIVYIIDWTKNLIITKQEYVYLTNFIEISNILSSKIINDLRIFSRIGLGYKPYLTFRDEILRDINKNSFMVETEEKAKILIKNK